MAKRLPQSAPPLILVVEDIEETRDGMDRLLRKDGYRLACARNGEEAVKKALKEAPDVFLVGLEGSDASVIEIACRVRARSNLTPTVPIVIFSANSVGEGVEADAGNNVCLIRPENFNHLRDCLRRILS